MKKLLFILLLPTIAFSTELKFKFNDSVKKLTKNITATEQFYNCNKRTYVVVSFKIDKNKENLYKVVTNELATYSCDCWINETSLKKI